MVGNVNVSECEAAGLDTKEVERIARGLDRYARQAEALGLTIFGGGGSGSLRFDDGTGHALIVAEFIGGHFDGGDGGNFNVGDNLLRGE
jgi:hypothetical protein|tara:strand:- start:1151 stop:1417 length:267 start_codon:yes stop_codon:yes gene_type:complete